MRGVLPLIVWPVLLLLAACSDLKVASSPCELNGKIYPSGTHDIPSGTSCNTCACESGKLSCTTLPCTSPGCSLDGKDYDDGTTGIIVPGAQGSCTCDGGDIVCPVKAGPPDDAECVTDQGTFASGVHDILAKDGCNTCSCDDGTFTCTTEKCTPKSCLASDGKVYPSGTDFVPAPDGCNFCTCQNGELVECTAGLCVDAGCDDGGCGTPSGAACVVNGTEEPSGTTDIQDPFSCNWCGCTDGKLECGGEDCPVACPADTKAGTSCARCGPTDACEAVEIGCFKTCDSNQDCSDFTRPMCMDGICVAVCG